MLKKIIFIWLGILLIHNPNVDGAISITSVDSFATDSEAWRIGGAGVQPARVALAGLDGQIGYLSHSSDGSGSSGKWLMWTEQSDWTGNYSTAGITEISLEAKVSSGTSPVNLRVAFDGSGGWFYSSILSIGANWDTYRFSLDPSNFTYATGSGGTGSFAATLASVSRFEILAGPGGVSYRSGGDLLQAGTSVNTIQFDNIRAIPEPGTGSLLLLGVLLAAGRRLRRV